MGPYWFAGGLYSGRRSLRRVRNHAEVIAYQVDDGGVLGCLFGVLHQELFRIEQVASMVPFMGRTLSCPSLCGQRFRGEADEPVFQPQLVQGFGVEEYFFQCQIGGDGTRQVRFVR